MWREPFWQAAGEGSRIGLIKIRITIIPNISGTSMPSCTSAVPANGCTAGEGLLATHPLRHPFWSAHYQLGYLAVYRTGTKRSRASIRKRSMSSLRDTESGTVWWSSLTLATFISFLSLVADSIANLRKQMKRPRRLEG